MTFKAFVIGCVLLLVGGFVPADQAQVRDKLLITHSSENIRKPYKILK